ncbi:MAG: sigma-70 family RNA polymerase sigma factor [Hyphomicrobiaceae bacterium]|nr:sigma-70 family RNA polymerase sigma factor [Hyphomicrobiaceae bacterium]
MPQPEPPPTAFDASPLIVAVARGDRAAFARLFEHFAPRIKAMLMRTGLAPQRAEDLAQETMLTVWRKAHLYNPEGASAPAWIFTIARNRRIDVLRHDRLEAAPAGDALPDATDESPLPDVALASAEDAERLRLALARLSAEQLKVVTLSFFESRPHSEIADMLGIPLGTVKSRLRLAMGRLRDLLGEAP